MAGLGDLFGSGSSFQQLMLWGVGQQVIGALISPGLTELQYLVMEGTTPVVLSPAELAQAVNRNFMDHAAAASDAAKNGLDGTQFSRLVELAGEAPGPAELAEALRRGLIGYDTAQGGLPSFVDGIRQGNLRDIWAPLFRELSIINPSWNDALDALLQGQLSREEALHWYTLAGGNPDAFQWLFDARGSAPTPTELSVMANRGIIPWDGEGPASVSFHQGFLEGPWRNKWEAPFRGLAAYHPPPRTVTALLRAGSITDAQALELFRQQGLSAELAAAYVKDAHHSTAATNKDLTKADIETLLADNLITPGDASNMLQALGYDKSHADLVIAGAQLKRTVSNTNAAVTRVRALYTARKLQKTAAAKTLHDLGLSTAQADELLGVWDLELGATVRQLTEAQIVQAFGYGILDQAEAQAELEAIGYTPWDAWVLLSIKNKGALGNPPARGPGPVAIV